MQFFRLTNIITVSLRFGLDEFIFGHARWPVLETLLRAMLFVDNVLELGKLRIWLNLVTRRCAVPAVIGAVAGSFNESTEPALLKS